MTCGFISPAVEDLCEQVTLESSRGTRIWRAGNTGKEKLQLYKCKFEKLKIEKAH